MHMKIITTILIFLWMYSNMTGITVCGSRLPLYQVPVEYRPTMSPIVQKRRLFHPRTSVSRGMNWETVKRGRVSVSKPPIVIRLQKPKKKIRNIVISSNTVHV